jgi:hypothetical protein
MGNRMATPVSRIASLRDPAGHLLEREGITPQEMTLLAGPVCRWAPPYLSLATMPAYGYTDPGTGSMLWQVFGAVLVGLMFRARKVVTRIWAGKRNGRI